MVEKIFKWVKIGLMIIGLFVVMDFLFDYNDGKVTMNVKSICSKVINKF